MRNTVYVVLFLVFIACQNKGTDATAPAEDSLTSADNMEVSTENNLTEAQKAEGWVPLFDGKTMDGWRTYKNKPNTTWEVVDGTLHRQPHVEGQNNEGVDLVTVDQYENFELMFDWKISPQGNSGVMFRVVEDYDQPYASGPEYQVIDNEGYPGDLKDSQLAGTNYDMHAATDSVESRVGEWNQARLVVNGNHVEHWLNGTKVVEYELNSPDWTKRRDQSKWKDFPGYAKAQKGHIDLQDHGNEVWYRNIYIKPM